jgi:hypothetical protein
MFQRQFEASKCASTPTDKPAAEILATLSKYKVILNPFLLKTAQN